MKKYVLILRIVLSLFILIFLSQIQYEQLSDISVNFLETIHKSILNPFIYIFTKIISYFILITIIVIYFIYTIIIKANIIDNATTLTFISWSVYIFCVLKMIFGELRPYMYALLYKRAEIEIYDCEPDFGMPSAHLFLATIFYYLFKKTFFCLDDEIQSTNFDMDAFSARFEFEKVPSRYKKDGVLMFGAYFGIRPFNVLSFLYLILLALSRFFASSHYILQTVCGFIFGYYWAKIFFCYLNPKLRIFFADIIISPGSREKSTKLFYIIHLLFFALGLLIALFRNFFRNPLETEALTEILKNNCKTFFLLEFKNVYDSLILIIPMTFVFSYRNFNLSKIIDDSNKNIRFLDLLSSQKILRFLLLFFFAGIPYIAKTLLDYLIVSLYPTQNLNILNMLNSVLFYIIISIVLSLILPYLYFRNDSLLEFEYLTKEHFDDNIEKSDMSMISDIKDEIFSPEKIIKQSNENVEMKENFDFGDDTVEDFENFKEEEEDEDEEEFEYIKESPSPEKKEGFEVINNN